MFPSYKTLTLNLPTKDIPLKKREVKRKGVWKTMKKQSKGYNWTKPRLQENKIFIVCGNPKIKAWG